MWRDPFDRILSAYHFLKSRNFIESSKGFSQFIRKVCDLEDNKRNIHYRSQSGLCEFDKITPDVIYRWDFDRFYKDFNIKEVPDPVNVSSKDDLWEDYLRVIYYHAFKRDFDIWESL